MQEEDCFRVYREIKERWKHRERERGRSAAVASSTGRRAPARSLLWPTKKRRASPQVFLREREESGVVVGAREGKWRLGFGLKGAERRRTVHRDHGGGGKVHRPAIGQRRGVGACVHSARVREGFGG
jgi:hypothetical protein